MKLGVTSTSAVSEPRTTATTATHFPRFRHDTAFGTYETDGCRRGCWRVYVGSGQQYKDENTKTDKLPGTQEDNLLRISLELTFAGLDALEPPVIWASVAASTPTILIPSTARSTTTGSS